ncbi:MULTISPECIES: CocE/NonD family hydrolase [Brevibacterium]|nr:MULTISPECIES: CocE/NonD family hydrolase [Brevibacterium]
MATTSTAHLSADSPLAHRDPGEREPVELPSARRYRTDPRPVTVIEHTRIPLSDGVELAARVWLPADLGTDSVPAVLEYIPYRKNDMTAGRDQTIHPEFARAGYASVRVDLRGAGDSTGIMTDEYSATELDDGLQVLTWIAAQDWCNGKVGIIGKSWGGFNGLQLAALRPPELAAVITVCSTDDRYADDVHYNGGAIVGDQMLSWASTMWAYNARPQDPLTMGEGWEEDWRRRIDESPVNIEDWLGHQRRDDYWKHASVCEAPDAIQVPVLAVGGLLDEYRTALFRLMDNAHEQRKSDPDCPPVHALLGPWAHNYPHQAAPGPGIDFIAEAVAWWDHWMSGIDNGIREQPQLRAFVPDSAPVHSDRKLRQGRWISEDRWPSPHLTETTFDPEAAILAGPTELDSTALIGFNGGSWLQFGEAAGMAGDQAVDDARSCTETWRLEESLEIVGIPRVTMRLSSSTDRGVVAARLCDVAPDGSSRLLTIGLFNLTHHSGHEHPAALTPGEPVDVEFPLLALTHRFAAGHRLRLSLSASFWPNLWPSPEATTITVVAAPELTLPVRAVASVDDDAERTRELTAALGVPPTPPRSTIDAGGAPMTRELVADLVARTATVTTVVEDWQTNSGDGLFYSTLERDSYERSETDPLSPRAVCERVIRYRRPALAAPLSSAGQDQWTAGDAESAADHGWDVELRTRSTMTGDAVNFLVTNELVAYKDGKRFHSRTTSASIPRELN